jgi:hypothetical protein
MANNQRTIMPEKYIQIDGNGKPDYINKAAGQAIPGVPKDEDLCLIEFKPVKIPKVEPDDDAPGGKKQVDKNGYAFTCAPSDECLKKNDAVEKQKEQLRKDIAAQQAIIDDPQKKQDHAKATKKKAELEADLARFPKDCDLKFIVDTGGDDKTGGGRFTEDEIKAKKIKYAYCYCQKVKAPEPPKKGK